MAGVQDIEAVYREHAARCYAFALRIARDRDLARGVVRDVFTDLARQVPEPVSDDLSLWLLTSTHRHVVAKVRQRSGASRHVASVDLMARSVRRPLAADTMAQLAPAEREVLALAYFEGLSYAQIAAHLALPVAVVRARGAEALRRLRGN